ncbi:LysR family transcriptional regulator [Pelomonas sp. SE-A7]|uniref:LysR family transcriptional regulator n=1 Tax=Pelomonas sp. SE-A7 TaxID=3054953 RepID=UPI00259D1E87|nr:LysR family transcriptional regulator [Pelomonas sp. SE-A7]MDM4765410.1 LysR family transcriptional regulator [Pelomonas sp. SE-A7]
MNLRQLNHLIALADEGRFVAAAERVHLSQAAFSRSIQTLEEHFGLRLFERGPLGAALTPAGRTLVERARQLVFDSRCLERDAVLLREGQLGELAFGAGPVPAAVLVPPLLSTLRRQAPQLVTRARSGNVDMLLSLLEDEEIDFFIADPRLLASDARLELRPLARIVGGAYVRPGHPLLERGQADGEDMRRHGIGMVSTKPALRRQVAQALGFRNEAELPLAVECDDLHTLSSLAREGELLAMLPHSFPTVLSGDLLPLQLKGVKQALFADVHLIWLRGRTLSPAAELAMQACRELAA